MKNSLILFGNMILYVVGLNGLLMLILLFRPFWEADTWLVQSLESLVLLAAGMGFICFFNRQYQAQRSDSLWRDWQCRPTLWAVLYGFLLLLLTQFYEQIRQWSGLPIHLPDNQRAAVELMQQAPLMLIVFAGILGPIVEELLFRGLLFCYWGRRIRQPALLILMSGCVFALPHQWPTDWDFGLYAAMGAMMGLCYWHTKSLKYAILSHFINNVITLIIMWQA